MKHLFLCIFPLLILVCAGFFGCSSVSGEREYPISCCFTSSEPIVLIKDTPNEKGNVRLVVNGENSEEYLVVEWDEEIIHYDTFTGDITALKAGSTEIKVSYKTSALNTETRTLPVCVYDAVFAQQIVLEDSYILKKDSSATYTIQPSILSEGDYNLTVNFFSANENVFTVDTEGMLTPKGVGEATLQVSAVCLYDIETEDCNYITQEALIKVEPAVTEVSVELYTQNCEPVERGKEQINLFYGIAQNSDNPTHYYAKIKANSSLKNSFIEESISGINYCPLFVSDLIAPLKLFADVGKNILHSSDYSEVFIPFRLNNSGTGELSFTVTDRALNMSNELNTNTVKIQSFSYIDEQSFNVNTTPDLHTHLNDFKEQSVSMLSLPSDGGANQYNLYALGGNLADKKEGHSETKYFYALILFDNSGSHCYNNLDISSEGDAVVLRPISDNLFYVQAYSVGTAEVNICAGDGGGWEQTIFFNVSEVKPVEYSFYQNTKIVLTLGEEYEVDLAVYNIEPSYATYCCEIELITTEVVPVQLSGSIISAKEFGNCFAVVTFNGYEKVYSISVISNGYTIEELSSLEYDISSGQGVAIQVVVLDRFRNKASNIDIGVIIVHTQSESDSPIISWDIVMGNIYFEWLASGIVEIQLVLLEQGREIYQTDIITINCL